MKITTDWMQTWFLNFNRDYFDGGLPLPRLALSRSRTRLGSMSCKRAIRWGRSKMYDFSIHLTSYYDMTERQAQNVLLHEMIHYSIAYTGLKDTAPHGVVFRGMMDSLNRRHGWEIRVMTSTKGWNLSEGTVIRKRKKKGSKLVLAIEMTDGKYFLSVVSPKYALQIDRRLMHVHEVGRFAWYTSEDSYFDAFPTVRSLRGKKVSLETYEEKTSEMKQCFL